jgi:hypothetical protein
MTRTWGTLGFYAARVAGRQVIAENNEFLKNNFSRYDISWIGPRVEERSFEATYSRDRPGRNDPNAANKNRSDQFYLRRENFVMNVMYWARSVLNHINSVGYSCNT